MKYKIRTDLAKEIFGITMYRIEALKSFGDVRAGDLGGFIEKEHNLSQYENAWVYKNAWVYGNARVSGNARVYGNARAYENARITATPRCITGQKHTITITETHIFIGCEGHTIEHWKRNIRKIGIKHGYTAFEIKQTIAILKALLLKDEPKQDSVKK